MGIIAFLGVASVYVIAQIFLVRYLGGAKTNWWSCLITMMIVTFLHVVVGEIENFDEIIDGCIAGYFITDILLQEN